MLGYDVHAADDGPSALALMGTGISVDLLLTDVVMPGMGGLELAKRLVKSHPKLRVLFTSGYTQEVVARHGELKPGLNYLEKPYTPQTLASKIRNLLDHVDPQPG